MNLFQLMQTHPIVNCILHQSFTVNYRSDSVDSIKAFYNVFQFFAMQLFPYIKTQSKIISASCIPIARVGFKPTTTNCDGKVYCFNLPPHLDYIKHQSCTYSLSLSFSYYLPFFLSLSFFQSLLHYRQKFRYLPIVVVRKNIQF